MIAADRATADQTVELAMVNRVFGAAGDRLVLEECLVGEEASYFVLADGTTFVPLSSAQDHKRIFDGDRGPNTGGMGAFSPTPRMTSDVERRVETEIVRPVLEGMAHESHPYRGFSMSASCLPQQARRSSNSTYVLATRRRRCYCRVWMKICPRCLLRPPKALPSRQARFRAEPRVGVVLASAGYLDHVETGKIIRGIEDAARVPGALVFHAATRRSDGGLMTAGGRVLTVVGSGSDFRDAIDVAYRAAARIRFDGMQFRSDIGHKALDEV